MQPRTASMAARLTRHAAIATMLAALPAQQIVLSGTGAHGAILATKDGLTLPAGEFSVAELIEATAGYLCRNYVYDAADVARCASFTLQRSLSLDALGSEEMLYALLASRDLVAVPLDELRGLYQVTTVDPDRSRNAWLALTPVRSPDEILRRPQLREIVMTSFELRAANAQVVSQPLNQLFGSGGWRPGSLVAMAAGPQMVLLHGYRDQIAKALLLLQQLDRMAAAALPPVPSDDVLARIEALEQELAALKAQLAVRSR